MEKSVVTDKAIEEAIAMNTLVSLSSSENEALLEVIQDCLLREDDPVDDSEVDSDGEWRVADDLEIMRAIILRHHHNNIAIIFLVAEIISSDRQQDTASVDTNEDRATKSMDINEWATMSKELPSLMNTGTQVPEAVRELSTGANGTSVTNLPTE